MTAAEPNQQAVEAAALGLSGWTIEQWDWASDAQCDVIRAQACTALTAAMPFLAAERDAAVRDLAELRDKIAAEIEAERDDEDDSEGGWQWNIALIKAAEIARGES